MRWGSICAGFLLLAMAVWSFAAEGLGSSTLMCAAAAVCLFLRGAGLGGGGAAGLGEAATVMQFVRNPAGAIVSTAANQLGGWLKGIGPKAEAPAEENGFDPDAILARYLAQRGPDLANTPADAPASPAPQRGFGRKGVQ